MSLPHSPNLGPTPPVSRVVTIGFRRKVLYSLMCFLAFLLLAEGAVRLRAWVRYGSTSAQGTRSMYVFDEQLAMTVPRAGYELVGKEIDVRINSLGFRGDEFSRQKPAGTIRIVCTGASTTFCEEVTNNQAAWPQQLEVRLRKAHPDARIEVINAGITGSAIDSSLKDLRGRLLGLDPDLVILYRANNDIVLDTRDLAIERGLIEPVFSQRTGLLTRIGQYSLLVHLVNTNLNLNTNSRTAAVKGTLDGIPPELPNRFVKTLGLIHDELIPRDVPLVLSRYLVKFRREQPRETQLANARLAFYHMPWASMDDLLDVFDGYNEAIAVFARSRGIPFADDHDSIPGDEVHFADYMHFTDAGCQLMADRFAHLIDEHRLIESIVAKRGLGRAMPSEPLGGQE